MEEGFRLNIKLILARIFIGSGGRIPAAYGQREIRKTLKGSGIRKIDISRARKELHVESEKIDSDYWWIWENEQEPEVVWKNLSNEFWRQVNERKGH
ncbi:MAG: hypothetical protein ACLT46_17685 [Hungatella sp.]